MTFLTRPMVLKVLQQIREAGGRLNRAAITRTLLKNYPAAVIDRSLKYELDKIVSTEIVKRKGVCRPIEDWVLLPDGYRLLGASVPNEVKPTPAAPALKQNPSPADGFRDRPVSAAPTLPRVNVRPVDTRWTPPAKVSQPEPGMAPPARMPERMSECMPEPVRVLPPNRDREHVMECLDGVLRWPDGSEAVLSPEQLTVMRRQGRLSLCHPPTGPGMHWDLVYQCWRG